MTQQIPPPNKAPLRLMVLAIILVYVGGCMFGCSSVHKTLSLHTKQVDSSSITHSQINEVKKNDSVGQASTFNMHAHDSSSQIEFDINATFVGSTDDTAKNSDNSNPQPGNIITGKINTDGTFELNSGTQKLKDLNIKSKSTGNVKDTSASQIKSSSRIKNSDSLQQKDDSKINLTESVKDKDKSVTKTGISTGKLIAGILILAAIAAVVLRSKNKI